MRAARLGPQLRDQALSVWVHSLDRAPAGPSFENMRDALGAEAAATSHSLYCAAPAAFADFGVGAGSSLRVRGTRSATVVTSTALPSDCP